MCELVREVAVEKSQAPRTPVLPHTGCIKGLGNKPRAFQEAVWDDCGFQARLAFAFPRPFQWCSTWTMWGYGFSCGFAGNDSALLAQKISQLGWNEKNKCSEKACMWDSVAQSVGSMLRNGPLLDAGIGTLKGHQI